MERVIILTGRRGAGKTTVCCRVIRLAEERGYTCAGLLTPKEGSDRYVVDARSHTRRRLTQRRDAASAVIQGRFRFSAPTLSWGDRLLSEVEACDLLIVDEIGPLEVERNEGWVSAFDALRDGAFAAAVVVVRPELVDEVRRGLPGCPEVLTVTRENRDHLPRYLVERLGQEMQPSR